MPRILRAGKRVIRAAAVALLLTGLLSVFYQPSRRKADDAPTDDVRIHAGLRTVTDGHARARLTTTFLPPATNHNETEERGLKVVLASLDRCSRSREGQMCRGKYNNEKDEANGTMCTPNYHIIGIRKCGSTDIAKWFQYHAKNLTVTVKGINIIYQKNLCPLQIPFPLAKLKTSHDWMNYGPGNILFSAVMNQNKTHMMIRTTMQYLAFLDNGSHKYLLTLRNPTDRLISYLFHAHNMGWIYKQLSNNDFNGSFVHDVVTKLLAKTNSCIERSGVRACVFMYNSRDGNLDAVIQHGLYYYYLEHVFSLVDKSRVYVNQLEEYSTDQLSAARKMMKFFGQELVETEDVLLSAKKKRNAGNKVKVLPETIKLLNDFYRPYNRKMAELMRESKWLYKRT